MYMLAANLTSAVFAGVLQITLFLLKHYTSLARQEG